MRRLHFILAAVLVCLSWQVNGQHFSLGVDPPSARWRKLSGPHYDIIYPEQMDSVARKYLYIFEKDRATVLAGLGADPKRIPLVLHPYSALDRSTVAWAPRRADLFTTPSPYSGDAQGWIDRQSILYQRQIGNMDIYDRGVIRLIGYLGGEQSLLISPGITPGGYLLKGDQLHAMTDFSFAGPGRDPDFLMPVRASFLNKDGFSYDNFRYGSYRHHTPGKDRLGYLLQSSMRLYSGEYDFLKDIVNDMVTRWYHIGIWNISLQNHTGYTNRKHFRAAQTLYTSLWQQDYLRRMPYTPFERISAENNRYYTEFHSPMPMAGGRVVAVRSGDEHDCALVEVDESGRVRHLKYFPSAEYTGMVRPVGDSVVVWTEIMDDVRWGLADHSILRKMDLRTGKVSDITYGTRYYAPAPSPDGERIALVELPVEGSSFIVVTDADGNVLQRMEAPERGQIKSVAWAGGRIFASCVTDNGWGLYSADAENIAEGFRCEVEPQGRAIRNMCGGGDCIFFETDLDGITNIYRFNPGEKFVTRVTNARFGAFSPCFDISADELYYTDYDKDGYHIVKMALSQASGSRATFLNPDTFIVADHLSAQASRAVPHMGDEEAQMLHDAINELPSERYAKGSNLFKLHSWAPIYANVDRILDFSYDYILQMAAPGFTLISQNLLGTATSQAGYSYFGGRHAGHFNFAYSGLHPVFEVMADYNDRARTITRMTANDGGAQAFPAQGLNVAADTTSTPALDLYLRTYVPIDLGGGGWNSGLVPEVKLYFSNDEYALGSRDFRYRSSLEYGVRYFRVLPKLRSALMPHLGFGVEAKGAKAVGPYDNTGRTAYLYSYGYLPGFTPQQGVKLSASYQRQLTPDAFGYMPNLAAMPRGYRTAVLDNYIKLGVDYAMPFYAGDIDMPSILYLMQVNVIPFADYAVNHLGSDRRQTMFSFGTAVLLRGHLFGIGAELSAGVRYSRRLDVSTLGWKNGWDIVFSTGL